MENINLVKVYVLKDPGTLKVRYIGVTKTKLQRRLVNHLSRAARTAKSWHVYDWIKSLRPGIPLIEEIASYPTYTEALRAECSYIKKYKEDGADLTNITIGGEGTPGIVSKYRGVPRDKSTRDKISATLKGHSYNKGITKTEEHKRKLALAKIGKKASPETGKKISQAHKKSGLKPPSWSGKKHTEETKEKMRASAKARHGK